MPKVMSDGIVQRICGCVQISSSALLPHAASCFAKHPCHEIGKRCLPLTELTKALKDSDDTHFDLPLSEQLF